MKLWRAVKKHDFILNGRSSMVLKISGMLLEHTCPQIVELSDLQNFQDAICKMHLFSINELIFRSHLQLARCDLQDAICKMQFARCNQQDAICQMQCSGCNLLNAINTMKFSRLLRCNVKSAMCNMQYVRCKMQCAI